MSAAYGVRFTCDHCGRTAETWAEDGKFPSIGGATPPGWLQCGYAQSGVKPLWQRPHVCPDCRPVLEAWEAEVRAWDERHREVVHPAYERATSIARAWTDANPRPSRVPPLARLTRPT